MRLDNYIAAILSCLVVSGIIIAGDAPKVNLRGDPLPDGLVIANRSGALFSPDSLAADSARIVAYYQNRGWLDCQLQYSAENQGNQIIIRFRLQKGERYRLACVPIINNPDELTAAAESTIYSYSNQTASNSTIETLADELLRLYADNGFPYCTINPGNYRKLEYAILQVSITVNPGPRVIIRRIEFSGLKNISSRFLDDYIGLQPPFAYSSAKLDAAARRLARAQFLKNPTAPELRFADMPENGIVYFPIDEISPVILDGVLGYSSKDKSLYGMVDGAVSNILGGGKQFKFNFSKKDKTSRKLRFTYSEPFLFHRPLGLALAAYQDDRDSLYIETGGQAGLTYMASIAFEYGLAFGVSRITPESYGSANIPGNNRRWLTLNFIADSRDDSNNPKSGDYIQMEASFINENTPGDTLFAAASDNYRMIKLDYRKSIAIAASHSVFCRLYSRGDFSGQGSIDRQFPVGGFGNLRGYNQDIFYVMRAAILTLEYRFLTGREGRAYIFSDMGFLQKGLGSKKVENKAAFGIGIAAMTKTGLAVVELAAPSDEGIAAIKLHFGMKAGF